MSQRLQRKQVLDEEEYLKYLMFLSEAVQETEEQWDEDISVPELAHLIPRAKDPTIRPYYRSGASASGHYFTEGDLPPISQMRQTPVKLPYLDPRHYVNAHNLFMS